MNNLHTHAARRFICALLLAFVATGCTCLRTADVQADYPEARTQIERRLQEVFDAADKKDFDRLDSYHLYGPKFTKFAGSSPERLDAAATRKGEHEGPKDLKMRADGLKIDVFGNVGIATFILDYSYDAGGGIMPKKARTTLVFVKDRGSWKITHEHLSPIKQ